MRAVIERVSSAKVAVDGKIIGQIGAGLLVLLGIEVGDTASDTKYIVDKTVKLRIFEDENEKLNLSVEDIGGEILVVSQFTLMGDVRGGRRPSFTRAMPPNEARDFFETVLSEYKMTGIPIATGEFAAYMQVEHVNDGPVTILLDSRKNF